MKLAKILFTLTAIYLLALTAFYYWFFSEPTSENTTMPEYNLSDTNYNYTVATSRSIKQAMAIEKQNNYPLPLTLKNDEEKRGIQVAKHIINLAQNRTVAGRSLLNELNRQVEFECQKVSCTEEQKENVKNSAINQLRLEILKFNMEDSKQAAIAGRIMIAGDKPELALQAFTSFPLPDDTYELLIGLMEAATPDNLFSQNGFINVIEGYGYQNGYSYSWKNSYAMLHMNMSEGQIYDLHEAFKHFIATLRRWRDSINPEETEDLNDANTIIEEAELLESRLYAGQTIGN